MRLLAVALGALLILTVGCGGPGAPKFPIKGKVLVNGQPAAGLLVRFISSDESMVGQDRQPVGMTNKDGVFELSSFGNNDGATKGTYRVTFFWPTNLMTMTSQECSPTN